MKSIFFSAFSWIDWIDYQRCWIAWQDLILWKFISYLPVASSGYRIRALGPILHEPIPIQPAPCECSSATHAQSASDWPWKVQSTISSSVSCGWNAQFLCGVHLVWLSRVILSAIGETTKRWTKHILNTMTKCLSWCVCCGYWVHWE